MIIDLDPADIPALQSNLVEGSGRGIHWGNLPDVETHLLHMRQDFVGLPELCYVHGKLVALIRRRLNLAHNVPTFLSLWATQHEFLITHLNTRWLVSACDTIAVHGSEIQRAKAAILSAMFHTLQLCETERLVMRDSRYDPVKYQAHDSTHLGGTHIPLWDGMKSSALEFGDPGRNMLLIVMGVVSGEPVVGPIARALITRALAADTVVGRLARLNSFLVPPSLSGDAVPAQSPHLTGAINGHNIVLVDDKFLVIPQSLGPLDLTQPTDRHHPGIIEAESVLDAVRLATLDERHDD